MRFFFMIFMLACVSEEMMMSDSMDCYQDSVPLQVNEESPIGVDTESYLDLIPRQFEATLYLEGGGTNCLYGDLDIHTETLSYVESEAAEDSLLVESYCPNHLSIEATLRLYTEDELLDEVIELKLELTEEAVQQGQLLSDYHQNIYGLEGTLGLNLENAELQISGRVGEGISGTISLQSSYDEGEIMLNEERIIAAWSSDTTTCAPTTN
jgi:hypothetical protein